MILAPIAGGALYDFVGKDFIKTTDIMTVVCLGWALIYFVFNVGFTIYSDEHKIEHKMELIRKQMLDRKENETGLDTEDTSEFLAKKR